MGSCVSSVLAALAVVSAAKSVHGAPMAVQHALGKVRCSMPWKSRMQVGSPASTGFDEGAQACTVPKGKPRSRARP